MAVHLPPTVELGKRGADLRQEMGKRQKHSIRFRREKFIRRHDRDIGPRHPPDLLGGRGVGDRRE
jgi:hypothetical protein